MELANPKYRGSQFLIRNSGPVNASIKRTLLDQTNMRSRRYGQLSKSNTLANRLNRVLPANFNFPEDGIREKMTSTALHTSKRYKLGEPSDAFSSQVFVSNNEDLKVKIPQNQDNKP